jgi:hypothetical protein
MQLSSAQTKNAMDKTSAIAENAMDFLIIYLLLGTRLFVPTLIWAWLY